MTPKAEQSRGVVLPGPSSSSDLHGPWPGDHEWIKQHRRAVARAGEPIALADADIPSHSKVGMKAHADLACAQLARGELDAAAEALDPAWKVTPGFRRHALVGRLEGAAAELAAHRYTGSPLAAELRERIGIFAAESAPRALAPPPALGMLTPGSQ